MGEHRWDSLGPFKGYQLVVNGWRVPLLEAHELDGGKVAIKLDDRYGYVCQSIAEADRLIPFLADVIACCWGYGGHPRSDEWYEENGFDNPFADGPIHGGVFSRVPHPSLAPHRVVEIVSADSEEPPDAD